MQDLNLSRFDAPEEGKKTEIGKINNTIDQLEQLSRKLRERNGKVGLVGAA